ncbi:MAG: YfcE family phosphodiesterase [Clostridiales bacterium GWC2_40_7]|nr:MAG: YfcE family phosphodiesterase [Clostridiales bacterium GWC2_40_7]
MRFAVIGDIHSNIYALESVMEDIKTKDVDFILCTGDMVGYAPFPNEVIDLLRKNNVLSIQGNYDRAIGNSERVCGCDYKDERLLEMAGLSVLFTNMTVTGKNRSYLKELPTELRLKAGELQILLVHGSHRRNNEYLFENSKEVDEVTKEIQEDILICGHTHKPYYKVINSKHVINSGSVGKPKHGNPNATYAIVGIVEKNVCADVLEVPYDYEKTAKAVEENKMLPDDFADMLRKG